MLSELYHCVLNVKVDAIVEGEFQYLGFGVIACLLKRKE